MRNQIGIILIMIVLSSYLASAITIKNIMISPDLTEPGEAFSVSIRLENNFDSDVENVQISLDLSNVPLAPKSSSSDFSERIKEGRTEDFNFELMANSDAEAGVYKFPVEISYSLEGDEKNLETTIAVTINAKPQLSLDTEGFLIAGNKNQLAIKITNSGLAKAKFLKVNIQDSTRYTLLSSDKIYIGDLNSDDFDSFNMEVYSANQGIMTIPLELVYKDFANNEYSEEKQISVRVYSQKEAENLGLIQKSNFLLYTGLIVFLITAFAVYRKIKSWRRKKNSGQR